MFLVDSDPTVDESLKYHGQIKLLSSNFFPTVCVDGIYLSLMILILFVFSRISIDSCFASKLLLCFQCALMILLVLDRERGCYNASDFVNNSLFTGILVTLLFTSQPRQVRHFQQDSCRPNRICSRKNLSFHPLSNLCVIKSLVDLNLLGAFRLQRTKVFRNRTQKSRCKSPKIQEIAIDDTFCANIVPS